MDEDTIRMQLALIREITGILSTARTPHWLVGGWAVDFLVGQVTRVHEDVDWSIWADDQDGVAHCLAEAGYHSKPAAFPDEASRYHKAGQVITFFSLQRNARGEIINPGRFAAWPWPDGSFLPGRVGGVGTVHCPVVSVEGQLDAKENQPGGPQRAKDHVDILTLRRLLRRPPE